MWLTKIRVGFYENDGKTDIRRGNESGSWGTFVHFS